VTASEFNAPGVLAYGYSLSVSSGSLELVPTGLPVASLWTSSSNGSWTNPGNWTVQPTNTLGAQVTLGIGTASPLTITLDGPQLVGQLTFANPLSATTGYTLSAGTGGGTLTMDNGLVTAQILVNSGTHAISAPLILAGNLAVIPTAGTTLNISGDISEEYTGSGTVSLEGPGMLILSGTNSYTGGTFVWDGTLQVSSSAALADGSSLSVGSNLGAFGLTPAVALAAPGATAAVPEPAALALLAVAGIVAAAWRRRRSKKLKNLERRT
jgi:autotransporter-associated beta strand protein